MSSDNKEATAELRNVILEYLEEHRFARGVLFYTEITRHGIARLMERKVKTNILVNDFSDFLHTVVSDMVNEGLIQEMEYVERDVPYRTKSLFYHAGITFIEGKAREE
jgi:hypothetical protein